MPYKWLNGILFQISISKDIIIFMHNNIRINVIVNIIRTFVLTLLSFITFPWVCRALGDSVLGSYTWANTFVAYFLILAKVGIPNLAVRECVKVRDNKELLSNKVQTFFLIQLVTTLISFALLCITIFSIPAFFNDQSLILVLSINFLAGVYSFEWVFIALEKQFYMSVRSIIALALSALLIVVFVTTPSDVYIYALFAVSVTIFTTIANLFFVRKYVSFKKTMKYSIKELIKPLAVLCALSLCLSLYNQTDTFILGFIDSTKAQVGSYSVGIKGIDIIIGIITALSTVFIPRSAYYYEKEDKRFFKNLTKYSINICLFVVLPAVATMTVLSRPICGLISGNYNFADSTLGYNDSPWVLIALSSVMLTFSLSDIIYGQILLPTKKENHYLFAILSGTILNIALSLILGGLVFTDHPAIGVAIGTSLTDLLVFGYLVIISWKWVKDAIFNMNSLKILLVAILVVGVSIGSQYLLDFIFASINLSDSVSAILKIVIIIVVAGIIYLGLLKVLKEDLIMSFFKKNKLEDYNNGQEPENK